MRISDWSSDVCSADLAVLRLVLGRFGILGAVFAGILRRRLLLLLLLRRAVGEGRADGAADPRAENHDLAGRFEVLRDLLDLARILLELSSDERRVGTECCSPGRTWWGMDD